MIQQGSIEQFWLDASGLDDEWLWTTPRSGLLRGFLSLLHNTSLPARDFEYTDENCPIESTAPVDWDSDIEEIAEGTILTDEETQLEHDAVASKLPMLRSPATAK